MKRLLTQLASLSLLGILVGALPTAAVGEEGKWFGGVDTGVVVPLNALDRFTSEGGMIAPFFGYMFFPDKDLTLNLGLQAQGQFLGLPADNCSSCSRSAGLNDDDTYALAYHAGPRLELPIGPVQLYGTYQLGGMSGLTSPSAATGTSWGMSTGGGINYKLNDNVLIGAFGRWNRWYQESHDVGDVRYAVGGIGLTLQSAPPPPPPPAPPVAQAPPPPPPVKKKIVLRGVNFDFDKSDIRTDARPILDEACSILKQEGNIDVVCKGYTDSIGTDAYNLNLSERRANAVRDYLVKCGIASKRIMGKGFGESDPVATNATPEGRYQNRRTELQVIGQ